MRNFVKIDRVDPMNFDQFWKIFQNLQPNEDSTICPILRFWTFFSSRVWQIIVLNYEIFFKKNSIFWILNRTTRFYKGMTQKICHTLDDIKQNLHFYQKHFSQKKVNFESKLFPVFVCIIFILIDRTNLQVHYSFFSKLLWPQKHFETI